MMKTEKIIKQHKVVWTVLILASCAFALMPDIALAGTGGKEWGGLWTMAKDWMQGDFGRFLSAFFAITGIAAGIVRQSLMTFAGMVGLSIGLYNAPTIIESLMTATLSYVEHVLPLIPLGNGLITM